MFPGTCRDLVFFDFDMGFLYSVYGYDRSAHSESSDLDLLALLGSTPGYEALSSLNPKKFQVCKRSLSPISLQGGVHRERAEPCLEDGASRAGLSGKP